MFCCLRQNKKYFWDFANFKTDEKINSKEISSEIVPAETNNKGEDNDTPKVQGGQDHSSQAQKRRDKVKEVRWHFKTPLNKFE